MIDHPQDEQPPASTLYRPPVDSFLQRRQGSQAAERADAHRKHKQSAHPGETITDIYNVLVKLRTGEPLTDKDRRLHEQGLVSVLRQIHDDLDAADDDLKPDAAGTLHLPLPPSYDSEGKDDRDGRASGRELRSAG